MCVDDMAVSTCQTLRHSSTGAARAALAAGSGAEMGGPSTSVFPKPTNVESKTWTMLRWKERVGVCELWARAPERGGITPEVVAVVVQFESHGGPNPAGYRRRAVLKVALVCLASCHEL